MEDNKIFGKNIYPWEQLILSNLLCYCVLDKTGFKLFVYKLCNDDFRRRWLDIVSSPSKNCTYDLKGKHGNKQ